MQKLFFYRLSASFSQTALPYQDSVAAFAAADDAPAVACCCCFRFAVFVVSCCLFRCLLVVCLFVEGLYAEVPGIRV